MGAIAIGLLIAWTNAAEQVAVVALYRYAKDGQMPKMYQDQGMQVYSFSNAKPSDSSRVQAVVRSLNAHGPGPLDQAIANESPTVEGHQAKHVPVVGEVLPSSGMLLTRMLRLAE